MPLPILAQGTRSLFWYELQCRRGRIGGIALQRGLHSGRFAFPLRRMGAAIGGATVYWFIAPRASGVQQLPRPPWARLVVRALRFIRRRRSVSLAFNNLGTYSLRPAENSRANQLRQRRASTPGPRGSGPVRPSSSASVLHEGPALQHGSDRSRDGGHRGH